MSLVSLCFFVIFGASLASVPPHVVRPVIDDAIWEAYGGKATDISAGAGARIPHIVASATGVDFADPAQFSQIPAPTSPGTGREADRYSYEDRGCNADCRVRYSPVTVYEWQPVSITATSTVKVLVTAGAEVALDPQNLVMSDSENAVGEFQMKNGVPYSALALPVLGNEGQNVQKTTVVDILYPTPVTVYPTSYNWDGKLMTPIGNPQIGMVWTCLRNVKSPISGKLSPLDGKDPWEVGNSTSSTDSTSLDGSFWRLVPTLRKANQDHIKASFTSDLALGYCKMADVDLAPEPVVPQYGIRYVTVTSTVGYVAVTPAAPLLELPTLQSMPSMTDMPDMQDMPNLHDMSGMSLASPIDMSGMSMESPVDMSGMSMASPVDMSGMAMASPIDMSGMSMASPIVISTATSNPRPMATIPSKHSKSLANNLQGFQHTQANQLPKVRTETRATDSEIAGPRPSAAGPVGAFTVHTEKTAASLIGPTPLSLLSSPAPLVDGEGPSPRTQQTQQSLTGPSPSALAGTVETSRGSHGPQAVHGSDPVVAVEPPAPLFINDHQLVPDGAHKYIADDGQVLIRNGPPIQLSSGERGSDHKMQVNLISGPAGADVLVVDGASQTLTSTAATGKPRPGRAGSSPDDYYGTNGGGYAGYGSPYGSPYGGSGRGGSGGSSNDGTSPNPPASIGKVRPAKYEGGAHTTAFDWSVGVAVGVLAFGFAF